MNYSIERISTPSGALKYELRVWHSGRRAKQIRRRLGSRKEAQNLLDKILKGEAASESSPFFGDEYAFWRAQNEDFAPGWKVNLDSYWNEVRDILECTRVERIETVLVELKTRWVGLSQKTINNKMGFIHAVLNHSAEVGRIKFNPLGAYKKPRTQDPDIEFWERHEAESFLSFLSERCQGSLRWKFSAVFTVLNTAVRAGELWGLYASDPKESLGSIRLVRQLNRVTKEFTQLKGKRARSVPMNENLLNELRRNQTGNRLVFTNDGEPVNHDVFREWFDGEVKSWGGRKITFHGLRHTAATLMLSAGVDVKSLQEIMGHKDVATTMKYVHALGDSAKRAGEKFSVGPRSNVLRLADHG